MTQYTHPIHLSTYQLLSISVAASRLGLKPDTVRKKIKCGEIIGALKIKGRWYLTEQAISAFIDGHTQNTQYRA